MKCEICHKAKAEVAVKVPRDGGEEEMYVCKGCAAKVRDEARRQPSLREKFLTAGPAGEKMPPDMLASFMNAMSGMVEGLEKMASAAEKFERRAPHVLACSDRVGVTKEHRFGDMLHLEGLFLVGELDSVQRALRALRMEIVGTSVDGITNVGHTFTLRYTNERTQAVRVVKMLNRIEYGARAQLIKMPTPVLGDSVLRAIAVLKNCRMLAAAECFDLLSPVRIAAMCHFLEGITIEEVDALMAKAWNEVVDLVKRGEKDLSEEEANARDREDMVRAEVANKSFERVILSERGAEELRK